MAAKENETPELWHQLVIDDEKKVGKDEKKVGNDEQIDLPQEEKKDNKKRTKPELLNDLELAGDEIKEMRRVIQNLERDNRMVSATNTELTGKITDANNMNNDIKTKLENSDKNKNVSLENV